MKTKISHLLKNHWSKFLSVSFFILLLGAYVNIFAIDNPFSPGQTLNPNCAPGSTNCYIDPSLSSPWLTSSNGIYYDGGGVGIGNSDSNINTQIQGGAVLSNKVLATFESPYQTDAVPAITTDNYGNPVIAYYLSEEEILPPAAFNLIPNAYASGLSGLMLIHCGDSSCNTSTETNVTENFFSFYVDSEMKPSIAVDSNNRVHIAFFVEGFLAYTICDDGVCTSTDSEEWGDIEPISSTGGNSDNFSLVLDGNDTPYIIYNTEDDDFGNYEVAIAKYTGTGTEDSCSFGGINPNWSCQKVLSDENADYYLDWDSMGDSIQINEDGNPVFISTYEPYIEGNISYITYNECSDSNCSSITTTVIDSVGDAGSSASALSLNNNGVPYIAYIVSPEMDLHLRNNLLNKFALINTAFASTSNAFNIFITYSDQDGSGCSETSDWSCKSLTDAYDPDGEYSGYFTLSMGADDLPQISATGSIQNFDEGIFDVYTDYIKCLNEECSNVTISNILSQSYDLDGERFGPFSPAVSSIVTSSNGSTYLSYINPENLTLNLIKVGSAEDVSFNTSNSLYSGGDLGVSGNLFVDGSIATSNGVYLNSGEPANVNNGLYNVDGELYWNGGPIFQDISSVPYADEAGYAEEAGYVNSANIATRLATYRTIFGYNFNGTSNITGTVSPSYGGTGRSSLTSGSLLVGNGTSAVNLIAPSTAGNVLTSNGSSWSSSALPTRTVAQGGTGRTTLTANNLMVGNGTSNVSFIAPGTSGNILTSNGSSWVSSALSIPTRTVAQGGTGLTTLTANNLMVGNGTSNVSFIAPGTSGNILTSNGSSWVSSALSIPTRTVAQGGTGLTTLTANNLMVGNGTSNVSFIAPGTSGNILTSNGSSWVSSALSIPTRTVAQGGTGLTTLTANNLMVGNGTSNVSFIAPGTSGNILTSNGSSWVSSNLPTRTVAQGGTGLTTLTANNLMVGNGTSNVSFIAPGTSGNILTSNGSSWVSSALSIPTRTVAQGGTGLTTLTANNLMVGNGTSNVSFIAPGTSGNILTSNGSSWVSSGPIRDLLSDFYYNTKGGTNAGLNLVTGAQYNTFLGYEAGLSSATLSTNEADFNTAVGYRALYSNTTGYRNTANGYNSLYSNTTGNFNTANGYQSLYSNIAGGGNVANGYQSLYSNTTGYRNTANGYQSLYSNTTGYQNTANGDRSLYSNTMGYQNTANGSSSLSSNTTGSENTAIGSYSLGSNTTGSENTASGFYSLRHNTTGNSNTANGYYSLIYNTTGNSNTANGVGSLRANTTGNSNTANGVGSLVSNKTGNFNTANGVGSINYIGGEIFVDLLITGFSYTIQSSGDTDFTLCGASNSTVGTVFTATGPCSGTGTASSNSNNNIGVGYRAGMYIEGENTFLRTSSGSIFLGTNTKALIDGSENEIVIGYDATGHGSNTATWGATSITNHYFSGNVQYSSYGAGTLTTDASGNITTSSDERLKDIIGYYDNTDNTDNTETDKDTGNTNNITENQKSDLERIIEINPIIYKWNEKSGLETEHSYVGFSAQNLQLAIPEAVGLDKRIDPETGENYLTISDRPILATVVNAIKEMDLKVKFFEDFEVEENTLRDNLSMWLANATNKITRIFTGEICLTDGSEEEAVCLNASELRELKKNLIKEPNTIVDVKNEKEVSDICPNIDGVQVEIPEESELNEDGNCVLIADVESVDSDTQNEADVESGVTGANEANTNTSTGSDNVENSESESDDQAGVDGSDSADDEEVVIDNIENTDNDDQNDGDVDGDSQTDEGDDNDSVVSD